MNHALICARFPAGKSPVRHAPLALSLAPWVLSLTIGAVSMPVAAAPGADGGPVKLRAGALEKRLRALGAELDIKSIKPSPAPSLREVVTDDDTYLYITDDGRHLVVGDLYELRDDELVNVTERARGAKRRRLVDSIASRDMVIFTPPSGVRASVTVFTDTDCSYCRRLHTNLVDYHAHGIEVRYAAFPRAGLNSPTYRKMVSAWCAKDPKGALTALKQGKEIPSKECSNPIASQYEIGRRIGLAGTPAIVLPDGRMMSGLVPPEQLAELLGL